MACVYVAMAVDGRDERDGARRRALVAGLLSGAGARVVNDDAPVTAGLSAAAVVEGNLRDIMKADVVVVLLDDPAHRYVGCIGEMVYAKAMGKTVYVLDGAGVYSGRPWIEYHADRVFRGWAEMLDALGSTRCGDRPDRVHVGSGKFGAASVVADCAKEACSYAC